jgi:CHASE2 domain-containing sensor protein
VNWKSFIGGNRHEALKGAAGVTLVGLLLLVSSLGNPLADFCFDFPFLLRADVPVSEVAMIYMDDESHGVLNQPTFERWDRTNHAQLIKRLTDYRPKAVVFDIWFSGAPQR